MRTWLKQRVGGSKLLHTQTLALYWLLVHTVPDRLIWILVYMNGSPVSVNAGTGHAGSGTLFSVETQQARSRLCHQRLNMEHRQLLYYWEKPFLEASIIISDASKHTETDMYVLMKYKFQFTHF